MKKENPELFESEWAILQKVRELEPCVSPTVQEALQGEKGWAYPTVKTMMDRIVKKGLLKTQKIRNLYLYRSAVTQSQASINEITRTLQRVFDGTFTPLMRYLIENERFQKKNLVILKERTNKDKKNIDKIKK